MQVPALAASRAGQKQKVAEQVKRCAETAERFPGWIVWVASNGAPVATRAGNPQSTNDGTWARTVIADNWDDLEHQLAAQAQNDAYLTHEVRAS